MWAPAAAVLLLTRHSLAECFEILHRLLPFIPVLSKNALETKAYRLLNFLVNAVEIIGFFVLCVLGWDKLIRNVGKYYVGLSKPIWYALSAVAAVLLIALCSGIPKRILKKLEPLALAGCRSNKFTFKHFGFFSVYAMVSERKRRCNTERLKNRRRKLPERPCTERHIFPAFAASVQFLQQTEKIHCIRLSFILYLHNRAWVYKNGKRGTLPYGYIAWCNSRHALLFDCLICL